VLNLLASFFKQCLSVCLACCSNELHCLCHLWWERPTGCLWHSRRLALMWCREFPLHFFVGGESVLMYKAFHWQMLSSVDFLGLPACSSSVKSSLLFCNALRQAETYFPLIMCSLYKLPVNLDWCFGLCMLVPNTSDTSTVVHLSSLVAICFQCLHLHNLNWHLAVTFSIIRHMLTHAQLWHVTEFVSSLPVASAAVECMFPSMNNIWSHDRNWMFECAVLRFIGAPNHTLIWCARSFMTKWKLKIQIFCDVMPFWLLNYYRGFGGACCLHLQGLSSPTNLLDREDGGSRFLYIVSKCVTIYMVLYLRRSACVLVWAVSCQRHCRDLGSVSG
jgi:hypothetical protein